MVNSCWIISTKNIRFFDRILLVTIHSEVEKFSDDTICIHSTEFNLKQFCFHSNLFSGFEPITFLKLKICWKYRKILLDNLNEIRKITSWMTEFCWPRCIPKSGNFLIFFFVSLMEWRGSNQPTPPQKNCKIFFLP